MAFAAFLFIHLVRDEQMQLDVVHRPAFVMFFGWFDYVDFEPTAIRLWENQFQKYTFAKIGFYKTTFSERRLLIYFSLWIW